MTPAGFSHSEISGSKPVCDSPELFAANYVLHRHLTPRHPSCALSSLTTNLMWNPERVPRLPRRASVGKANLRSRVRCGTVGPFRGFPRRRPGFHEILLDGFSHHQLSRHAVSGRSPPEGTRTPTPSRPWSADVVQGRDRSSSSELQSLDSIDARFQFLKTRFRVVNHL
jgi:hypothetical protein